MLPTGCGAAAMASRWRHARTAENTVSGAVATTGAGGRSERSESAATMSRIASAANPVRSTPADTAPARRSEPGHEQDGIGEHYAIRAARADLQPRIHIWRKTEFTEGH